MLTVTVFTGLEGEVDSDVFNNISYVSLLNDGTHGPPPIIAPTKNGPGVRAKVGQKVLYINTALVPLFEIERTSMDEDD